MHFRAVVSLLGVLLFSQPVAGAGPVFPAPFEAEYSLHSKGFKVANIQRAFRPLADGTYIYESRSKPVGVLALFRDDRIVERSHWRPTGKGFQPLQYVYQHSGSKKNRDVDINFDWTRETVHMRVNENRWQMELEPRTLDKMLYQLAVMRDLQYGLREFSYRIADGGKMKTYHFETFGEESVETPYGTFTAIKLERYRDDRERETILWCVPELDYLPVKVVNIEPDGLKTTALLESYTALPDTLPSTATVEDGE